jgi:hypothetical protein
VDFPGRVPAPGKPVVRLPLTALVLREPVRRGVGAERRVERMRLFTGFSLPLLGAAEAVLCLLVSGRGLLPLYLYVERLAVHADAPAGEVEHSNLKSLRTASVYVDIPALGLTNRVLAWAHPTPDPERTVDIHHGRHHHTEPIAAVGPTSGLFYLRVGYGQPVTVGPGRYEITVYVKGRDAMMTEARLEIIFTLPNGVRASLL